MSPNLKAWLRAYLAKANLHLEERLKYRIFPASFTQQKIQDARAAIWAKVAGEKVPFIAKGLRHTYASNYLAIDPEKRLNKLVIQLGHQGNPQILLKHYHRHTRKSDAEAYWQIYPKE
jgi:integrase